MSYDIPMVRFNGELYPAFDEFGGEFNGFLCGKPWYVHTPEQAEMKYRKEHGYEDSWLGLLALPFMLAMGMAMSL